MRKRSKRNWYGAKVRSRLTLGDIWLIAFIMASAVGILYLCSGGYSFNVMSSSNFDTISRAGNSDDIKTLAYSLRSGGMTNIPDVDDKTVTYKKRIDITKGQGDFVNISKDGSLTVKSYTRFNNNTSPYYSTLTAPYFVNDLLLKECVDYEPDGVVKLFDRYIFVAVGTYWADAFGLTEGDRGNTYRVYLSTGSTYDIICVDTKSANDIGTSVNSPSGKSIAHAKSNNRYCVTEFYILSHGSNYPIKKKLGSNPEINYKNIMKHGSNRYTEGESDLANTMGDFGVIPEFSGEVIALELIEDTRVIELLDTAIPLYIEKYGD